MPPGGLNIRWPDPPLEAEKRLFGPKMAAVQAFARANQLDRIVLDGKPARLGIVTTGKAYLDLRQALADLGISDRDAAGARPAHLQGRADLAAGGERRQAFRRRPAGRAGGRGEARLHRRPADAHPLQYRRLRSGRRRRQARRERRAAAAERGRAERRPSSRRRWWRGCAGSAIRARCWNSGWRGSRPSTSPSTAQRADHAARTPFFCSGCPHNTSTSVPEGSRAMAGIGCHGMALSHARPPHRDHHPYGRRRRELDRPGALHQRAAHLPESRRRHLHPFRPAGARAPPRQRRQHHLQDPLQRRGRDDRRPAGRRRLQRSRRSRIRSGPKAPSGSPSSPTIPTNTRRNYFPPGATVHHRRELDAVQRELREIKGLTVLIYDQTCAAEKRRRRKRGLYPDPPKRVFINELVCEGCGDCSQTSNCVSVQPLETEFGRKRQIDQSNCNKDYSCVEGFCPSFVTVHGGIAEAAEDARRSIPASCSPTCRCRLPARSTRPTTSSSPASAAPASSPSARCSAWPRMSTARAARRSTSPACRRRTAR